MIQYPKNKATTFPTVVGWGTNMGIMKDPPREVWSVRRDKVGDTMLIANEIDASHGRFAEAINYYPRGQNPMVSIMYNNTGSGLGSSSGTGGGFGGGSQASLAYKIMNHGAFRPPLLRQEDLQPLSRQSRLPTRAYTNIDDEKYILPVDPEQYRKYVKDGVINPNVTIGANYYKEMPLPNTFRAGDPGVRDCTLQIPILTQKVNSYTEFSIPNTYHRSTDPHTMAVATVPLNLPVPLNQNQIIPNITHINDRMNVSASSGYQSDRGQKQFYGMSDQGRAVHQNIPTISYQPTAAARPTREGVTALPAVYLTQSTNPMLHGTMTTNWSSPITKDMLVRSEPQNAIKAQQRMVKNMVAL